MGMISILLRKFISHVRLNDIQIYNEFSLQHEFGIFLRQNMPSSLVQFERNVGFFFQSTELFTKKEIDIVVYSRDKEGLQYAVELKYPKNGQYPEQMFSFCKDIAFAEELNRAGFSSTALIIFADDPLFYHGASEGIYGFFRNAKPLHGRIQKPTGNRDAVVDIAGCYDVRWKPISGSLMYALIEIGLPTAAPDERLQFA